MRVQLGSGVLELVLGDVTRCGVEAVVTAANSSLAGGGGVDGVVHRAAGPSLLEACREFGGCPTGEAVVTLAGDLNAKRVVHAVGPVFGRNGGRDDDLLRSVHLSALRLAEAEGCKSIAFPAISCGVYGFPVERASRVALAAVLDYLAEGSSLQVFYCLFNSGDLVVFESSLASLVRERGI